MHNLVFIIKFIWKAFAGILSLSLFFIVLYVFVPPLITPVMIYNFIEGNKNGGHRIAVEWSGYGSINPNLPRAIVATEDARFMQHTGFDWKAVKDAINYNKRHKGRKKRGASTITMQTVKNTILLHDRNFLRKGMEILLTPFVETYWSKKRILEIYMNVVEWGGGVYGAQKAAKTYFKKEASILTSREASLMAAVLRNPNIWSPARPTNYILGRAATTRARMNGVIIPK